MTVEAAVRDPTAPHLEKREAELARRPLSDIPGSLIEDVFVPARGFMPARTVAAGDVIRIIDVEGQQVADLILYNPSNLKDLSSMSNTVMAAGTWRVTTGHSIYSKLGKRMATIVEDTVGMNVAVGGFCSPGANAIRYGIEGTHSCLLNFVGSMADYNLAPADIEEDGCFVPFMNMEVEPDGRSEIRAPISKPGDHLDLRADMDVILALSNCPGERNPCNARNPTSLRVVIYRPEAGSPES